jgi:hypothetical protein
MNSYCPECREWLVEYLIEQGVALACPLCSKIYNVAVYMAESPAFPYEVRQDAEGISDLAKGIGLIALLAAIFDRPKRRRR